MNYNRKIMRLELSAEKALNGGYYYAELLLPAADYEIKDAMQRTRAGGRENTVEVSILECDILPDLQDIRLDTFSLDELNFLAKRLASLPDEELPVFYAVTEQIFNDADENPVSIKDLINCTYGLDTVPVAHNVSNLSELGRFAFENELLSDLEGIPESAVPFLNAEQIGRVQQKNDNGVFEGRLYIPTVHYDRPEIYDGVTLPEEEPENAAFLLKVGAYPKSAFFDEDPALHDLCLPADSDELFNVTAKCGEPEINLCFCYEFYSSIPQITSDMFDSMEEIDELNTLAQRIAAMSESEQTKFKAVLDAENTASIHDALNAAQNLWRYEFTAEPDTADAFFKKYILENTSTEFDSRWLENLLPRNEADKLLGRIGAAVTDYGVISARNGHLFKPVPYDEPEAKELKTQAMTEEKLDVIEILDRRALFSNGRLMPEQIPEGLYAYDLRHSDDGGRFCSIEPKVGVNHGGTVLMRDILDFGESGYIPLDEDTEPNFLGETRQYRSLPRKKPRTKPCRWEVCNMSISTVTTDDLRHMNGKEGLVLQGCGGDPQEWLDGINELLTDEGILKDGSKFENISVFQNGSLTNILFPFEDGVEIDMGKLAMWRLHSHEQFGGTWLSDYVPNRLGGFITEHEPDKIKPDCRLIGEDGNIFNLMGLAARTLRHNGLAEQATEMAGRIHECGSYDEALCIIGEYVNITGSEESEDEDEGMGMRL